MVTPISRIRNPAKTGNQQASKFIEESGTITENHISRRINISTPMKLVAGLVLGATLLTAMALPSNPSADAPDRPVTTENQLVIKAEIEDGAVEIVEYKRVQVGVNDTGAVGVMQAVLSHDEGVHFSEQEWVEIMAELEDELV